LSSKCLVKKRDEFMVPIFLFPRMRHEDSKGHASLDLPNVPLLSCGRIQKSRRHQVEASEPVVLHHGRAARRCKPYGAAVSFNGFTARDVAAVERTEGVVCCKPKLASADGIVVHADHHRSLPVGRQVDLAH
jgi:hypothetical protein